MDDPQELDYTSDWIDFRLRPPLLEIVDSILLGEAGRLWERTRDLLPYQKKTDTQNWTYTPQELRTSRLGQALLTIADCAEGNFIVADKVQRAMKRAARMLYGDPQSEGYTLPADFHKTELGLLFHQAYSRLYAARDLLTAKQAYSLLGIARQTLYERRDRGKLTSIYWYGELRFLRSEIEAWKALRNQRQPEEKNASG
jgi:predicted DNA-binding transcriptional regulator AlpA